MQGVGLTIPLCIARWVAVGCGSQSALVQASRPVLPQWTATRQGRVILFSVPFRSEVCTFFRVRDVGWDKRLFGRPIPWSREGKRPKGERLRRLAVRTKPRIKETPTYPYSTKGKEKDRSLTRAVSTIPPRHARAVHVWPEALSPRPPRLGQVQVQVPVPDQAWAQAEERIDVRSLRGEAWVSSPAGVHAYVTSLVSSW